MNRRNFLKSMLLAASAPAIVKAENLMKIFVPDEKIITLDDIWDKPLALPHNGYIVHSIPPGGGVVVPFGEKLSVTAGARGCVHATTFEVRVYF